MTDNQNWFFKRRHRCTKQEKSIITRKIGTVKTEVFEKVTDKLFEIIKH